jgi:carbonic anhydrase
VYDLSHVNRAGSMEKRTRFEYSRWVYGLNSGFVTDLKVNISSNKELDEVYQPIYK